MESELKLGSVVRVKSGGPNMTIDRPINLHSDWVDCTWFVGSELKEGRFRKDVLMLVPMQPTDLANPVAADPK